MRMRGPKRRTTLAGSLVVTGLLGCGPGQPASSAGADASTTTETAGINDETEPDSSSDEAELGTDTDTFGDTGTNDDSSGICGDGKLDPDEQCDDGNRSDGDGCSARCMIQNQPLFCDGNKIFECGDGIDNDDDGLIDTDDLECISPCDDSEFDLCDWLPQGGDDCGIDCAFDNNYGTGDDQCGGKWGCYPQDDPPHCTPLPPDNPACSIVDPACVDFCGPLLPNGCDCFGCCEIDGQTLMLNSRKWIDNQQVCCDLDDLDGCSSCAIRLDCFNACEPESCELCFGQTIDELPPGCAEPSCPPDRSPCASAADCPAGWFCQTGCCLLGP